MTDAKVRKPPERLEALGAIYRERNAVYGDTYKNWGKVMMGMFPRGLTVDTEEDWNRLALFMHCVDKLTRYGGAFARGGHVDSLDDNSVYSQMLQEYDELVKSAKEKADASVDNGADSGQRDRRVPMGQTAG